MKLTTRTSAGHLAVLAAGVAIGFAAVGSATAAPAATASAAAAGAKASTHHYSLAASAFAPDGLHNTAADYFNAWDPSTLSNQDSGRCFNSGLSLPSSAVLKSVTVYYTAGTSVMYFELNRQDLINHTAAQLISFDSATTTSPAYTVTTKQVPPAGALVNMKDYAYSAGVCPAGNTGFSGLTITYTLPAGG
jgi:hypothetical protein